MTNKYDEFFKHFNIRIEILANVDYECNEDGDYYHDTELIGETEMVILNLEGKDLIRVTDGREDYLGPEWVDKFEASGFDKETFLANLKEYYNDVNEMVEICY